MTQARDIVDQALATAMHAMRVTTATTLGSTPGALAFSRVMFLNFLLIADWHAIAHANCMSMTTFAMPTGSEVNMTMLRVRKF